MNRGDIIAPPFKQSIHASMVESGIIRNLNNEGMHRFRYTRIYLLKPILI